MFYNLCDVSVKEHKDEITKSYSNMAEVRFVLALYDAFLKIYPNYKAVSVVVLTPYNEQKTLVDLARRRST